MMRFDRSVFGFIKRKTFYPYVDILNVYYEDVAIFVDDGSD